MGRLSTLKVVRSRREYASTLGGTCTRPPEDLGSEPMTSSPSLFHDSNLYVVFIFLFVFLLTISQLSFTGGVWVRNRRPQRAQAATDFIPSTILGLVALILGFTFSMAITRADHRLALVVREANAIGTTFLRSHLIEEAHGREVRTLLKKYVDARLEFFDAGTDNARVERAEATAAALQNQLWDQTIQITRSDRGAVAAQFVSSLNEVIDLQAERAMALKNTIPKVVYWVILMITSVGLGSLAFTRGAQNEVGRWNVSLLVFLFVSVFTLIRDLDHPRKGILTVNQAPMRELQKTLSSR